MRVPWRTFRDAQRKYLDWEAFAFWVRTILDAEGELSPFVRAALVRRCPGFLEERAESTTPLSVDLFDWIQNRPFARAKCEGWLGAVMFYGFRHVRSHAVWNYWEHCERRWERHKPRRYPTFRTWFHTARNYDAEFEIPVVRFEDAIERYVEWSGFVLWLWPLFESRLKLPAPVAAEVERRLPGFVERSLFSARKAATSRSAVSRFMPRIEARLFATAREDSWLSTLRRRAQNHAKYVRFLLYSDHWRAQWANCVSSAYPSHGKWLRAAENYIESQDREEKQPSSVS